MSVRINGDLQGVTLEAGDVQIGAVELKNATDDTRATVTADGVEVHLGAALPAGTNNIGDMDVLSVPAPLSSQGGGTEAAALRVTVANDSTGLVSVDDNGGSLTVDGSVSLAAAIPAGSNNIGDVDVLSIAAGDNNIGNVDIASALPAGSNNIGDVDVASIAAGTNVIGSTRPVEGVVNESGTELAFTTTDVNATVDGDNTIIAAPGAGNRLRIVSYQLTLTGAGSSLLKSGTTTVGRIRAAADGGGAVVAGSPHAPAVECAANEAFVVNTPTGVDTLGHVTHIVVPS